MQEYWGGRGGREELGEEDGWETEVGWDAKKIKSVMMSHTFNHKT